MVGWKALSATAGGVFAIIAARQLGPSGRGVLALALTVPAIALLFCALGVNTSGRIHLPVSTDGVMSGDYLGLAVVLVAVQAIVCLAAGLILLPQVGARLTPEDQAMLAMAGAAMLAQYLLNDLLNGYGRPTIATAVDAAGSIAQLFVVLLALAAGGRSVGVYIAGVLIGNAAQLTLGLVVLRRGGVSIRPRVRFPQWRLLVRSGLPAIFFGAGQVLAFRIDRYLVAAFLTPAAVGVYAVAATGPELMRLPAFALGQPVLYRVATRTATPSDLRRVRMAAVLGTAALIVSAWLLAPWMIDFFFGPRYRAAVNPFRILLLAEVGITVFNIDGAILTGLNRVADPAGAAMAGLGLVIVADVLLIPSHGLIGAAWASAFAYSMMGLITFLRLRRHRLETGG